MQWLFDGGYYYAEKHEQYWRQPDVLYYIIDISYRASNLGQNIEDKFLKLSKIGFSVKYSQLLLITRILGVLGPERWGSHLPAAQIIFHSSKTVIKNGEWYN